MIEVWELSTKGMWLKSWKKIRPTRQNVSSERRGGQRAGLGGRYTFSGYAEKEVLLNEFVTGFSSSAHSPLQINLMSFQSFLKFSSDIYLHVLYRYRLGLDTQIYFKELAHGRIQVGKSKICRFGQQAGNRRKS